jgi:hypothetical protein
MISQAEQAPDVRLVGPDASDEEEEGEEDKEESEYAPTGGLRGNLLRAQREYFAERLCFFEMIFFVITKETQNLRNFP